MEPDLGRGRGFDSMAVDFKLGWPPQGVHTQCSCSGESTGRSKENGVCRTGKKMLGLWSRYRVIRFVLEVPSRFPSHAAGVSNGCCRYGVISRV